MEITKQVYLYAEAPFHGDIPAFRVTNSDGMQAYGWGPILATAEVTFEVEDVPTVDELKKRTALENYAKARAELDRLEAQL